MFDAENLDGLSESLAQYVKITGKDYSMDTAAKWALSKKGEDPDIFLIDGQTDVASVDFKSGKITRDRCFVDRLKDIRISRPASRVILLLPPEKEKDLSFLQAVTALAVYDIIFVADFNVRDVLNWFDKKKTLEDVKCYLPGMDIKENNMEAQRRKIEYSGSKKKNPPKGVKIEGIIKNFLNKHKHTEDVETVTDKKSTGRPVALLGIGDMRIEQWITDYFSEQMNILASLADKDLIKEKVLELKPDILIVMRESSAGGLPDAGQLAVWAADKVRSVLFIVGELDAEGREMVDRARDAGLIHIITCEKGGYISGDELVFVLTGIIKKINGAEKKSPIPADLPAKAIEQENGEIKKKAKIKAHKKKPPKISMSEGVLLEDEVLEISAAGTKNATSIVPGGLLAVVSPWQPNLAGRIAAQAVKMFSEIEGSEVVYIGAQGDSTGAVWLEVSDEELMMSDWRVPGSNYPVNKDNIRIYGVDPVKNLLILDESELWNTVRLARRTATYTVVDLAGNISFAQKAAHQGRSVLLAILPGADPVELKIAMLWLKNLGDGKQNIVTGIDLRGVPPQIPRDIQAKVVIRNNPADALNIALKKNGDGEFIW